MFTGLLMRSSFRTISCIFATSSWWTPVNAAQSSTESGIASEGIPISFHTRGIP
jgi:hypothetical protein